MESSSGDSLLERKDAEEMVKQTYRGDYKEQENKIFLSKLNYICQNYEQSNSDVSFSVA